MNKTTRIAKNTLFLSIRMIIVLIISLYITRKLLEILGVEDYGIYNVVCGFVSMFSFINLSMNNAIQRFYSFEIGRANFDKIKSVFNISVVIQLIAAMLVVLLLEVVGLWYLENKLIIPESRYNAAFWVFQFSVFSVIPTFMQVPFSAAILAYEKMDFYAGVNILDAIIKLLLVLSLRFFSSDTLVLYGTFTLLISSANFLLYAVYALSKFDQLKLRLPLDKDIFGGIMTFSGWNLFGSLANIMKEQGINVLLNLFYGPVVNAARGVAAQVNGGIQGLVQNLGVAMKPQLIQSYASEDNNKVIALMYSMSKLSYVILYSMALPIIVEIKYVLHIWLGNNVPQYTSEFVVIIIATAFIGNLNSAVSTVVHATGQMKKYQLVNSFVLLTVLPLTYAALYFGANPIFALSISFVIMVLMQMVSLVILKDLIRFSILDYFRKIILPILIVSMISCIFPILLKFIMQESLLRLLISVLVSVLCIIPLSYYLLFDDREKSVSLNLIRNFIAVR